MMLPSAHDIRWIQKEVSSRYSFAERAEQIIVKITSPQFKDGLAGVYGHIDPKTFERHAKAVLALKDIR